jgi:type I restriction enzyme, S subunit
VSSDLDKSAWERVTLRDVVRHVTDRVDPETSGLERFLAGEHIPSGDLAISSWGVVGRDPIGPMFWKRFKPGHVLYVSRRSYLRKVAVPEFEGITGEKTFVLESVDPDILLQALLPFVLSAERFHGYAIANSRGSVNPYLNWGELAAYEFDLPPLDEQKRIADLLWAIEYHRQALASARQSARAVLHRARCEMFEGSVDEAKADEYFDITIGRQRSPKHETGAHLVPYLRSANVTLQGIDVGDVKSMNFEPREQEKFALMGGDVLVSEASGSAPSVGMPAVWREELPGTVCFQNTLLRYRSIEGVSLPAYVEHYCHWAFDTGRFLAAASGTNIRHIGVGGATSMTVRRATIPEQEAFIAKATAAAEAVQALEVEFESARGLLARLTNDFFGGG